MRRIKAAVLTVAVALAATLAGFAFRAHVAASGAPAYTIKFRQTVTNPQTGASQTTEVTKFISSTGALRALYQRDGRTRETVFVRGRGLFERIGQGEWVRNETASVKAGPGPFGETLRSELEGSPQFVRTEQLLGRSAYVARLDKGGGRFAELYIIPELGAHPVRHVEFDAEGREIVRIEPVTIITGEPSVADLVGDFR